MLRRTRQPHSTIFSHMPNLSTHIANNWSTLLTNMMWLLLPRLFTKLLLLPQHNMLHWHCSIPLWLLLLLLWLLLNLPPFLPFSKQCCISSLCKLLSFRK